jgi:hypothetical protein
MSTAAVTPDNPTALTEGTQPDVAPVSAMTEGTQPPVASAPAPAAPEKPSLWRNLLAGALSGMAASAGGKSLGEGLALGAKGELAREQTEKDDAANQDQAKQAQIKQAADIAHTQAMTAQVMRATSNLPENHQQTVIEGRAEQTEQLRRTGAMIPVGNPDPSTDHHVALQQVTALTKAHPGRLYTAEPVKNSDGKIVFQAFESTDSPLTEDVDLKDIDGNKVGMIPKGTPAAQATKLQVGLIAQGISDLGAKAANDKLKAQAAMVKANKTGTGKDAPNYAALGPDALGFQPKLPVTGAAGYQKTAGAFKKNIDDLSQTEQSYQQFADVVKDINAGKDLTGAQSVVALFNAIGISAEPLKGKGFRINNLTVAEHAGARGIDQAIEQKFGKLKTGEIITPQQLKDYAGIAAQVRENKYVSLVNQMHNVGLNADAALPTGNGQKLDPLTAKVFVKLTGGNKDAARAAAQKKGWTF